MRQRRQSRQAFTLIEVMVAFAILATGIIAMVGLQIDSLRTLERLTHRIEADLWAEDAYARHLLTQLGYSIDKSHPKLTELHPDWQVEVEPEPFDLEELPFVPVLPVGWQLDWVNVKVLDGDDAVVAEIRPLLVHSQNADFSSESPTPLTGP